MQSKGFEPAIAGLRFRAVRLHDLHFPQRNVKKTLGHELWRQRLWGTPDNQRMTFQTGEEHRNKNSYVVYGQKGLRESIRTLISLRMLQCEKPRNMGQCTWPSQVLPVPYENRVAKPTAPELKTGREKRPKQPSTRRQQLGSAGMCGEPFM